MWAVKSNPFSVETRGNVEPLPTPCALDVRTESTTWTFEEVFATTVWTVSVLEQTMLDPGSVALPLLPAIKTPEFGLEISLPEVDITSSIRPVVGGDPGADVPGRQLPEIGHPLMRILDDAHASPARLTVWANNLSPSSESM